MKIVHLFAHGGGGGAEAYALNLAQASINNGEKVLFLIGDQDQLEKGLIDKKIEYVLLDLSSSFNPIKVVKAALEIKKIVNQNQIDIIHTHMLREQSLVILAKILGLKVVLIRTFHRLDQFNWKMLSLIWLYNRRTDGVIAISDYLRLQLIRKGIREELISLIYNGVEEIKVEKTGKELGCIGRISPEKGIKRLIITNIEALKKDSILIAGDGPDLNSLKRYVADNGANVFFLGHVSDRGKFFSRAGVLVLPSETEVMPLVVLEAFSAKIPVVTFDLPSLVDIVPQDQMVKKGDYEALYVKAKDLLVDGESVGLSNYQLYKENYTLEKMFKLTYELYKSLL